MAKDYDHLFKLLIIGDSGKWRHFPVVPLSTWYMNVNIICVGSGYYSYACIQWRTADIDMGP